MKRKIHDVIFSLVEGCFSCFHLLIVACAPKAVVEWVFDPIFLGASLHQDGHLDCFIHVGASRLAILWIYGTSMFFIIASSFVGMH